MPPAQPSDYGEKFGGTIRRSKFGAIVAPFKLFRGYQDRGLAVPEAGALRRPNRRAAHAGRPSRRVRRVGHQKAL